MQHKQCCSIRQLVNQEPFSFPVSVISLSVNNPDITTGYRPSHAKPTAQDMTGEAGQSSGAGGYFQMQQLGAGCSWRDWSGDFKANATLKDFGSALEEMPAAAAMVGVERAAWDEKVKKAQAAGGGLRVQGYSTGCSYSKGSVASTGAGVPGGEQSKEKGHADSLRS